VYSKHKLSFAPLSRRARQPHRLILQKHAVGRVQSGPPSHTHSNRSQTHGNLMAEGRLLESHAFQRNPLSKRFRHPERFTLYLTLHNRGAPNHCHIHPFPTMHHIIQSVCSAGVKDCVFPFTVRVGVRYGSTTPRLCKTFTLVSRLDRRAKNGRCCPSSAVVNALGSYVGLA
jgi:hypothetical protein